MFRLSRGKICGQLAEKPLGDATGFHACADCVGDGEDVVIVGELIEFDYLDEIIL